MFDEHSCDLYDQVRPIKWHDPEFDVSYLSSVSLFQKKYDLVVIGGGAGGLVTAASAVGQGAKVALIERNLLGGDCLNTGCVPSKAFLKCANVAHSARTAEKFGVKIGQVEVDFPFIMDRMRKIRAEISVNDSAERFQKSLGVDVYLGNAKFVDQTHI